MKNNTIGYITLVLLLSVTAVFSLKLFMRQRSAHDKLDIHTFPLRVGQWRGKDLEVTEKEYDILETRNLISREYVNSSGEKLYLFIIYSETNRAVFHPPEVCLIGSGMKITDKRSEEIVSSDNKFCANKLYTEKEDYRGMALYCYKAGNLYTDNFYLQQLYFALNQLLGSHKGGATIRVSMPTGKDEEVTLKILKDFLAQSIKIVDSLL